MQGYSQILGKVHQVGNKLSSAFGYFISCQGHCHFKINSENTCYEQFRDSYLSEIDKYVVKSEIQKPDPFIS